MPLNPNSRLATVDPPPPTDFTHDLACAVLLGFLHVPGMAVSVDVITRIEERSRKRHIQVDWLSLDDPLGNATHRAAGIHRSTAEFAEIRQLAHALLTQRGVLAQAESLGYAVKREPL